MINPEGRPTENGSGVTDAETFAVTLTLDEGYAFDVDPGLPGARTFRVDETPPLGSGSGPNPSRVLATAIASCLCRSLLFLPA